MAIVCFYGALFSFIKKRDFIYLALVVATSAIIVAFYATCAFYYPLFKFLLLLPWTILTGSAGYLYFAYSRNLHQCGLSASGILAVRFWLLFIVCLFIVIKEHQYHFINPKLLTDTLLVGFMSLIIPVYCSQKSIEKLGEEYHGVLIALTPFFTFLLEKTILHISYDMIGYLSVPLAVAIGTSYLLKRAKTTRINQTLKS